MTSIESIVKLVQSDNLSEIEKKFSSEKNYDAEAFLNPMRTAICLSRKDILVFFVKKSSEMKINPWNKTCDKSMSLEHYAAWSGNLEVLQFIYNNGYAQPFTKNSSGNTPLHLSIKRKANVVVKFIFEYLIKQTPETTKNTKSTKSTKSTESGQLHCSETLFKKALSEKDEVGNTLIHIAFFHDNLEAIDIAFDLMNQAKFTEEEKQNVLYPVNNNLLTPLFYLMKQNNLPGFERLFKYCPIKENLEILLYYCAKHGANDVFNFILQESKVKLSPDDIELIKMGFDLSGTSSLI
jgi:ankyrin repeat protein